jgi:signal transduction histidine kinase
MTISADPLAALALDSLPQSAIVVDAGGRVLLRNRASVETFGPGEQVSEVLRCMAPGSLDWSNVLAGEQEEAQWRNVCFAATDGRQITCDVYARRLRRRLRDCPHFSENGDCPLSLAVPDDAEKWDRPSSSSRDGAGKWGQAPQTAAEPVPISRPAPIFLIVVQDVSERLSMERLLAGAQRLSETGRLSAEVAHELNNPLDGVLRYISLAKRSWPEAAGAYLDKATDGLMRMAQTIREFQDRGRPWSSGGEIMPLERLLEEALSAMQPRAHALGVNFLTDAMDCQSLAAPGAMFQVFCNVIKNSLDAMPGGGLLTVRLRPQGDRCRIEFMDSGPGVAPEMADRIFEPFFTTKPRGEGTGLGLSICREIVTRLGGEISAANQNAPGLCVRIVLPVKNEK